LSGESTHSDETVGDTIGEEVVGVSGRDAVR